MLAKPVTEVIFIGLPGPTHNYGGLSTDNVASSTYRGQDSNPREAALQVLGLARLLTGLGATVAFLPPQLRPHLPLLKMRFRGTPEEIITQAAREAPALLESASSSSAMWTANAATVTGIESEDRKLHITPANLQTNVHRRIEAEDTHAVFAAMFSRVPDVRIHPPLSATLRDEGAANHMRLAPNSQAPGLHVFVFGTDDNPNDPPTARQSLAASEAIATRHKIAPAGQLFIKQNPEAIARGVFHNDVVAVSNGSVLLAHAQAYKDGRNAFDRIKQSYHSYHGYNMISVVIGEKELTLDEAVQCYFFNSQLVTTSAGTMALIAPIEVQNLTGGKGVALVDSIIRDRTNPIEEVHYVDLRQSMQNGGGPACLRLRVPMSDEQLSALKASVNVVMDEALLAALDTLITKHYPEKITPSDLGNPALYYNCVEMLKALSVLMKLPLLA